MPCLYAPAIIAKDGSWPAARPVWPERLWPRGLKKEALHMDAWLKDVAPSDDLRRWFSHDPDRWLEFRRRYTAELQHQPAVEELRELSRHNRVTLLFGARDSHCG